MTFFSFYKIMKLNKWQVHEKAEGCLWKANNNIHTIFYIYLFFIRMVCSNHIQVYVINEFGQK